MRFLPLDFARGDFRAAEIADFAVFADLGSAFSGLKTRSAKKTSAKTAKTAETVDFDTTSVLVQVSSGEESRSWRFLVGSSKADDEGRRRLRRRYQEGSG